MCECVSDDSLKGQDNSRSQVTLLDTSPAHTLLSICGVLHTHIHSDTCLQDIIYSKITNYSRSHSAWEINLEGNVWKLMSATKKRREFVTQVWHFSPQIWVYISQFGLQNWYEVAILSKVRKKGNFYLTIIIFSELRVYNLKLQYINLQFWEKVLLWVYNS